jgi:hypothetical protein
MARPENDYCIYKCIYNFIGPACEVLIATHLYYVHLLLTMLHLLFLLTFGNERVNIHQLYLGKVDS